MKKVPSSGRSPFGQPPRSEMFDRSDRRRLILMTVVLVVLIGAFITAQLRTSGRDAAQEAPQAAVPDEPELIEEVAAPTFDVELLRGRVSDGREGDRVLREEQGIALLMDHVSGFGDPHFAALGVEPLDEAAYTALFEDPAGHRAKPFRARGTLEDIRERTRADGREQAEGRLRLEDGGTVYFSVHRALSDLAPGDFVRLDGLFFKVFRDEVEPGRWAEGPLLVGERLLRSHPPLEPFAQATLEEALVGVRDDGTDSMTRLTGDAGRAQWELVRYVQRPEALEVDWDQAPELDSALLANLVRDGHAHRGRPFFVPISRLQALSIKRAGENPLRLERLATGWIGNSNWSGGTKVIWFVMPPALLTPQAALLQRGDYVVARGFFLKNLAYEDSAGVLRTAPYFVFEQLQPFEIPESRWLQTIAWFVAGLTIFLAGLFIVLLMRDRKKAAQFQAELVRRRRARRERLGGGDPQPGTAGGGPQG